MKRATLYAISKKPLHVPRRDGNPQHIRKDGRDERVIALCNGEGIRNYIERSSAHGKTELFIPREMDVV